MPVRRVPPRRSGARCFALTDLPGLGESAARDRIYLDLYARFLQTAHVVVYVLCADRRDFSVDLAAFDTMLAGRKRNRVVIGVNAADKIEPLSRTTPFEPSLKQRVHLQAKVREVSRAFSLPAHRVVPYSATERWNLDYLTEVIVDRVTASLR